VPAPATHDLDLARLRLSAGEGRRFDLAAPLGAFDFGGERYAVVPDPVPTRLDVARTTHGGWSLRLRLAATLEGRCMRCLGPAAPHVEVDAREVHQPADGEELDSPYVSAAAALDLAGWARDALALALPAQVLCRPDCAGLCPVCGAALAVAGPDHVHEREPDPRWAALRDLEP